jgi:hypothetical protein
MSLAAYRTLGKSGLVVSPAALGTMTFGRAGWGSPDEVSRAVFDAYVDAGGNLIDTADIYSAGRSEELVGAYVAERGLRDRLVLATKFGWNAEPANPNAGGNGRKAIHRALEGSLRRLRTDYIDLYWMHVWDMITPVEEVLQTFGDLVRAGKFATSACPTCPLGTPVAWPPWRRSGVFRVLSLCRWNIRWWRGASSGTAFQPRANAALASYPGARSREVSCPANTPARVTPARGRAGSAAPTRSRVRSPNSPMRIGGYWMSCGPSPRRSIGRRPRWRLPGP